MEFLIKQIMSNSKNIEIPFLKFNTSNDDKIKLLSISSPYLYLIFEGKIQFSDLKVYKAGEYFISDLKNMASD